MTRPSIFSRWHTCATVTAIALSIVAPASAQSGGQGGTPPMLVPLTGRSLGAAVVTAQTPIAGGTGVDSINSSVQIQGAFGGSIRNPALPPLAGALSLRDAIARGLEYNLGALNVGQVVTQARGQRTVARSVLLPNIVGDLTLIRQQVNLEALGVRFSSPIPGFTFPTVVGPFNQVDLRARLSQTVFDRTAANNYRSTAATVQAHERSLEDAQDLVVLAVGGAYLQAVAARARVAASRVQLETANVLYRQNEQRRAAGLVAQVDVGRSEVQVLTQQQRLISLQNEFTKQKINLARMIGLPPTDQYDISGDIPFAAAPTVPFDVAVRQARDNRADLKAAEAHVRAAELALAAAHAERLPSVVVSADYGAIGGTLPDARGTFSIVGKVRVPIWQGGRTDGEIQQAEAAVLQRRAELDDLGNQIEGDIRRVYLDLEAAAGQIEVTRRNEQVTLETLNLTRQRFDAGVSDNVEVVQAQEAASSAALDYINSVFSHNLAKLSLARAIGVAAERLLDFLKMP